MTSDAGFDTSLGDLKGAFSSSAPRRVPSADELRAPARKTAPTTKTSARTHPTDEPASKQADKVLTSRITVFYPIDLKRSVELRCAQLRVTRTALVLMAMNATHTRLKDLVTADLHGHKPPQDGGLFDIPDQDRTDKALLSLYPTIDQTTKLNELTAQTGARDRSHMISVALRAYLSDNPT